MKRLRVLLIFLLAIVLVLSACSSDGGNSGGGGSSLAAPVITVTAEDYGANYIKWEKLDYAKKYNIYRKVYDDASDSWTEWESISSTKNDSCTDSDVTAGVKYAYRVRATDSSGNKGEYSIAVEARAKEATIPFVSVEPKGKGSVTVTLRPVEDVSKYRIYRRERNETEGAWGEWEFLAEIDADTTTYTDTGLTSGVKYGYRATAVSASGVETDHSNGANVTVE